MPDLPRADKEQCGAFIVCCISSNFSTSLTHTRQRDERVLVVWSENLDNIIPLCRDFEDNLIKLVWARRHSLTSITPGQSIAGTSAVTPVINSASDVLLFEKPLETVRDSPPAATPEQNAKSPSTGSLWGWRIGSKAKRAQARDPEKGGTSSRPTRYFAPVYGGLGLALSTCKVSILTALSCH
jgi:hypothetical protein